MFTESFLRRIVLQMNDVNVLLSAVIHISVVQSPPIFNAILCLRRPFTYMKITFQSKTANFHYPSESSPTHGHEKRYSGWSFLSFHFRLSRYTTENRSSQHFKRGLYLKYILLRVANNCKFINKTFQQRRQIVTRSDVICRIVRKGLHFSVTDIHWWKRIRGDFCRRISLPWREAPMWE